MKPVSLTGKEGQVSSCNIDDCSPTTSPEVSIKLCVQSIVLQKSFIHYFTVQYIHDCCNIVEVYTKNHCT